MAKPRKTELTAFSRAINAEIKDRRPDGRPTQEEIADAIGKTQPYVSGHLSGAYPWSTNDLDLLAPLLGTTAFQLVAAARKRRDDVEANDTGIAYIGRSKQPAELTDAELGLVATEDDNKLGSIDGEHTEG